MLSSGRADPGDFGATAMLDEADHLPMMPDAPRRFGIGLVGAGFIARDCQIPAYRAAGFRVEAITSRTPARAAEVAAALEIPRVLGSVEELAGRTEVDVIDVAVPPLEQPEVIRRILAAPRRVSGILAQKPLAMTLREARAIVDGCREAGVVLQVNQNMRHDHSVRACRSLLDRGAFGEVVLATIEMRAIPHWMPWAEAGRSLSTFIMSIHHLDAIRYWLGDPSRVLASTRPDPRTKFAHSDGINLTILEYDEGPRASICDDVWAGPAREGAGADLSVRWRVEGTEGLALGTIGWPGWPSRVPSTIDYSTVRDRGVWHRPRWPEAWFPDAFAGTMAGLLRALERGEEPDIPGDDNLKTLALCEAVLEAARDRRVVEMPIGP